MDCSMSLLLHSLSLWDLSIEIILVSFICGSALGILRRIILLWRTVPSTASPDSKCQQHTQDIMSTITFYSHISKCSERARERQALSCVWFRTAMPDPECWGVCLDFHLWFPIYSQHSSCSPRWMDFFSIYNPVYPSSVYFIPMDILDGDSIHFPGPSIVN